MSPVCLPETVVSLGDTQIRWCLSGTLRDTERQWCLPDRTSRGGHPQVAECLRCLPETVVHPRRDIRRAASPTGRMSPVASVASDLDGGDMVKGMEEGRQARGWRGGKLDGGGEASWMAEAWQAGQQRHGKLDSGGKAMLSSRLQAVHDLCY
ncbi:hypothetical protein BGX38DRAFT_1280506 [Terfezia claveryi]|nr:hypothetical protein BGX38DRAFT_1280506 [Terfezia claveryi]